jgi:hypothetical protein
MLRKLGRILYLLTPLAITVATVDFIRDNHHATPRRPTTSLSPSASASISTTALPKEIRHARRAEAGIPE